MTLTTLAQSSLDALPLTLAQTGTRRSVVSLILQNLHIIIFIAVALSGVLGRVAKSVREARAERQRALARERAELDALRTGRDPRASGEAMLPTDPEARLEERRLRIEQNRQRQSQRTTQPVPVPATGGGAPKHRTRFVRLPGGVVIEVPESALPPNARTAPHSPQSPPRRAGSSQPAPQASKQPAPQRARSQRPTNKPAASRASPQAAGESSTTRLVKDVPEPVSSARSGKQGVGGTPSVVPASTTRGAIAMLRAGASRDEVRRAFVLAELLGPPRAMRDQ